MLVRVLTIGARSSTAVRKAMRRNQISFARVARSGLQRAVLLTLMLVTMQCHAQTICIDPGHPSENGVGTKGKHITELKAAWLVGEKLAALLRKAGYTVIVTKKSEGQKLTNKARAEIGNRAHADLMLRLHCDAGTKSGFATYYPGAQGQVGNKRGPSADVLSRSAALAPRFHRAVIAALNGHVADRGFHSEASTMIGARQGALTGSIYSQVPVLLVEMTVLQNAHDDLFISTAKGQDIMAVALFEGVRAVVPRR